MFGIPDYVTTSHLSIGVCVFLVTFLGNRFSAKSEDVFLSLLVAINLRVLMFFVNTNEKYKTVVRNLAK